MSSREFKPSEYLHEAKVTLDYPILFNIIHLVSISKSKLNQLDSWKAYDDPNNASVDRLKSNNKKMIRDVNLEDNSSANNYNDIYKLLLKDRHGNYCYAYEYNDVLPFLRDNNSNSDFPLSIRMGGRIVVEKSTEVSNGVILLKRNKCQYLGINDADKELIESLNADIVKKYISLLNEELLMNK